MKPSLKIISILTIAIFSISTAQAATGKISLKGKLKNSAGYQVVLMATDGNSKSATTNSRGSFTISNVSKNFLTGATLQLIDTAGRYAGPVVLATDKKVKTRGFLQFSGKGTNIDLKTINLSSGFAKVAKISTATYNKNARTTVNATTGKPAGAGKSGVVASSESSLGIFADSSDIGRDLDGDGIPSAFDFDDDGDLNLDGTDPDSASTSAHNSPFTTLNLSLTESLNDNIGNATQSNIDAVIGGEGQFNLAIYFSADPDLTVTGGHVVCDSSLVYCRKTADGGSTAIYSGASESDDSLRGQIWSDLNADGSGFPNLEIIRDGDAYIAFVQPKVGTSQFSPGDTFQAVLVNGSSTVQTKTLSLPPYFVTVPAIKTYTSGSGLLEVDYDNSSTPGSGPSNTISITSSGLLTINYWRPQRQTVSGAETGSYKDMGHLHYGVIVGGVDSEFTCGGLYSSLSGTLTEDSTPLGTGDSIFAQDGANLWPLTDSSDDAEPDAANILSFTVNLKTCITRAGLAIGNYQVTLVAAGEDLSGGANRSSQIFYVTAN